MRASPRPQATLLSYAPGTDTETAESRRDPRHDQTQRTLRLRDEIRYRLGAAFDIRDFHSAILDDDGSLPLAVLDQDVAKRTASCAGSQG